MDQGSSYYSIPPWLIYTYYPPPLPYYSYGGGLLPFPAVRLRGLPSGWREGEIVDFLHGLDLVDVLRVMKGSKFTGVAYCVLGHPIQVDFALQRNGQKIGRRYVEVFRSERMEYYRAVANEISNDRSVSVPRAMSSEDGRDLAPSGSTPRERSTEDGRDLAPSGSTPTARSTEDWRDLAPSGSTPRARSTEDGRDLAPSGSTLTARSTEDGRDLAPSGSTPRARSTEDGRDLAPSGSTPRARFTEDGRDLAPSDSTSKARSTEDGRDLAPSGSTPRARSTKDGRNLAPSGSTPKVRSTEDGRDLEEHMGVLHLRGLPFSTSKEDIIEFFKDFSLSENSIHLTANSAGRETGEAFVKFSNAEDSKAAMPKDKMTVRSQYIEILPSSREELEEAVSRGRIRLLDKHSDEEDLTEGTSVLRMIGLPYSATNDEIKTFFKEFVLSDESIHITFNYKKRGPEGFVEFANPEDAKAALAKDRMTLGSRYIELFPSSLEELNLAVSRVQ